MWAQAEGLPAGHPREDFRIATEEELAHAASRPGVTLGAHTWSHSNLAMLSPDEVSQEMNRPLSWLRERFASARPWIAYPYGITTPLVAQAAERAGYTLGFRVSGGWVRPPTGNGLDLPRWSVPAGLSQHGFILHASGFLQG
jgi:peptidoglycan/xylan/chitin deacetylase (PgdA/CDA1 family)